MAKKDKYDTTSTARQESYLERLAKDGGKAVRVDFSGPDLKKLDELVAKEEKGSRAEVIRLLVRNAHDAISSSASSESNKEIK